MNLPTLSTLFASVLAVTTGFLNSPLQASIKPSVKEVGAGKVPYNVLVVQSGNWSISANQSWISFSPATGNNNQFVLATVDPNTTATDRVATVTVGTDTHTVTQRAASVPLRELWAVGDDSSRQLGDLGSPTTRRTAPVQIAARVSSAVGGANWSLILFEDGTLWGVGANDFGQLGVSGPVSAELILIASSVRAIAAGEGHSLFIKTDDTLWGMGLNTSGQLGIGSNVNAPSPVQIAPGVSAVCAGARHTAFIRNDGALLTTGDGSRGQLGTGTLANTSSPIQVQASGVRSVAAGESHTLIVKIDNSLWGAGDNSDGKLGLGPLAATTASQFVEITWDVSTVAAGSRHSLFVKTDGSLWAMGENKWYQIADLPPDRGNGSPPPVSVPIQIATNIQAVAAGEKHTAYLTTAGALWAVGFNQYGEIGDGTTSIRRTPYELANNVRSVSTGLRHTFFVAVGESRPTVLAPTITSFSPAALSVDTDVTISGSDFWAVTSILFNGVPAANLNVLSYNTITAGVPNVPFTAGPITVVARNGSATSGQSFITQPTITSHPQSVVAVANNKVTFSAVVTGVPAPTFQWRRNGVNIAGTGAPTLSITALPTTVGTYDVTVSNAAGSITSDPASLQLAPAPAILTQPANQTVATGRQVSIVASVVGNPSPTYLWQVSSDKGVTWSNVSNDSTYSGATTASLTINATASMDDYRYRYIATNTAGSVTSDSLTLVVTPVYFPNPVGIARDAGGSLYITDGTAKTVQKLSVTGDLSTVAGATGMVGSNDGMGVAARFGDPAGIVVDSAGNLFVADKGNATIRKITPLGMVTTLAGQPGVRGNTDGSGASATFAAPIGIALDTSGNLYVADSQNATIRKITAAGVVSTFAGLAGVIGSADGTSSARFNMPSGVAVDSAGNVYVTDTFNHTIRKITAAGTVSTLSGLPGISGSLDGTRTIAQFAGPIGITSNASGNLWIADTGNSLVRAVALNGTVTTVAGLAGVSGLTDGLDGLLNQPHSVVLANQTNLFVSDTGNAAIRRIAVNGSITTISPNPPQPSQPSPPQPTDPTAVPAPVPTPPANTSGGGGGALGMEFTMAALMLLFVRLPRRGRRLRQTRQ